MLRRSLLHIRSDHVTLLLLILLLLLYVHRIGGSASRALRDALRSVQHAQGQHFQLARKPGRKWI